MDEAVRAVTYIAVGWLGIMSIVFSLAFGMPLFEAFRAVVTMVTGALLIGAFLYRREIAEAT